MHARMDRRVTRCADSAGYPPHLARRVPSLARLSLAVLLAASLLVPLAALAHPAGVTERVSVASDGTEGNGPSPWLSPPAVSADGRYVAFDSAATNLFPGGSLLIHVYVHDRLTGTTQPVTVNSAGREGDQGGSSPAQGHTASDVRPRAAAAASCARREAARSAPFHSHNACGPSLCGMFTRQTAGGGS